jgi:2'-5' RNA ligase
VAANWFVALPVQLALDLRSFAPPPGVRLFAPADLHLTVAFLGAVPESAALAAFEAAADFPLPAMRIAFAGIRALGSPRRPSAFSLCVGEGRSQVEAAMGALRARICAAAGVACDPRPPLAHVTLARPRRSADAHERRAAQTWAEGLALPPLSAQLERVCLYTWSEDRQSALFRIVREQPLSAAVP